MEALVEFEKSNLLHFLLVKKRNEQVKIERLDLWGGS